MSVMHGSRRRCPAEAPGGGRVEPSSSTTDVARCVRALIAAAVTVLLAVAAHLVGNGDAPPMAVLLPVIAAVWAVTYRLSRRRINRWQFLVLLGGAQLAVHTLSTVTAMPHQHGDMDATAMAMAHAVSTVVTALVLGYGEQVWWLALSWIRRHVPAPFRPMAATGGAAWSPTAYRFAPVASVSAGVLGMRAPPAAV